MAGLRIPKEVLGSLKSIVMAGYPYEVCGLMTGKVTKDAVNVCRVMTARNLNTERAYDRYELAPDDMLSADQEAKRRGLEIVGIWHSHPEHPAQPSETDRTLAWEGWSYVILSVTREGVADVRSWRLNGKRQFVEEGIETWPT
ncbi:MAG: M67 family metallopeptidase [Gammaproteobacteria bacterium]|nr:M67 family metallopeptidase [Gammaproteobacteria bacterium]